MYRLSEVIISAKCSFSRFRAGWFPTRWDLFGLPGIAVSAASPAGVSGYYRQRFWVWSWRQALDKGYVNDSGLAALIHFICLRGKTFAPQAKISESNLGKKKWPNFVLSKADNRSAPSGRIFKKENVSQWCRVNWNPWINQFVSFQPKIKVLWNSVSQWYGIAENRKRVGVMIKWLFYKKSFNSILPDNFIISVRFM